MGHRPGVRNDFGPITNMATGNVLTDPASSVNGTRLVMEHGRGDLSGLWRVSYHHYVAGIGLLLTPRAVTACAAS